MAFPEVDAGHISKVLRRNNDDFNAAANELMRPSSAQTLADLCELDVADAQNSMAKNNGDLVRALVDVLATTSRQKKAWTSRVQDRAPRPTYVPLYIYDQNSDNAVELAEYVAHNKELQRLNYAFLKQLLVYFQGNVIKVLEAAKLIVDARKESLSFHPKLDLETFTTRKPKAADLLRAGPSRTPSPLNIRLLVRSSTNTQHTPTLSKPNFVKKLGTKLDLHGYVVKDAVDIAEEAVDLWWSKELQQRETEGYYHRYGQKSQFVEPLELVTGRGIHSQGGPKIRGLVIRMLTQRGYVFEEETGRVVVTGKKA